MVDQDLLKCELDDHGWELAEYQPDKYYWRYRKDDSILDYWFTTGTCRVIKKNIAKYYRDNTIETIIKLL